MIIVVFSAFVLSSWVFTQCEPIEHISLHPGTSSLCIPRPLHPMSPVPQAFASFLAAALVLIPSPSHGRARNVPTLSLILWLFVLNVAHGVNVIVWWDNLEVKLLIWCDIGMAAVLNLLDPSCSRITSPTHVSV